MVCALINSMKTKHLLSYPCIPDCLNCQNMEQEEETCQNTSQNQINQTVSDLDEGSIGSIEVYKSMSQKEDVN